MDLAYQPIVDLRTGAIPKVEALLRPSASADRVSEFITFAESSGRIKRLTNEVLDVALADWRRHGRPGVGLSVNLSLANLDEPDLARRVEKSLKRTRYEPATLWFELGERAQEMNDSKRMSCMRAVSSLGVRFSLDSFGSDLSLVTLNDLGRLPWRELKIDGAIVTASAVDLAQRHRVKSTISIAQQLSIDVTAKGIESANVAALMARMGATHGQGHFFAHPVGADGIGALLDALRAGTWTALQA